MPLFKAEAALDAFAAEDGSVEGYWLVRTRIDDRWRTTHAQRLVEVHGMAAELISRYLKIDIEDVAVQVKVFDSVPASWND